MNYEIIVDIFTNCIFITSFSIKYNLANVFSSWTRKQPNNNTTTLKHYYTHYDIIKDYLWFEFSNKKYIF